jgi:hypothetical protein
LGEHIVEETVLRELVEETVLGSYIKRSALLDFFGCYSFMIFY